MLWIAFHRCHISIPHPTPSPRSHTHTVVPLPHCSPLPQAQMATRAVPKEEVEALSAKHNACVFETSAKVGTEKKAHLDRRMWWCFQVSSEGGQGCRGFFMFVM
jgi:hypothetical protein